MKCETCGKSRAYYGKIYSDPIHCRTCKSVDEINVTIKRCKKCNTKISKTEQICKNCIKLEIYTSESEDLLKDNVIPTELDFMNLDDYDIESTKDYDGEDNLLNGIIDEIVPNKTENDNQHDFLDSSADEEETEEDIERWKVKKQQLKNIINIDVDEIKDLKTKLNLLEKNKKDLQEKNKELSTSFFKKEEDYKDRLKSIKKELKNSNQSHEKQMANINKINSTNNDQIKHLIRDRDDTGKLIDQNETNSSKLKSLVKDGMTNINKLEAINTKLVSDHKALQKQIRNVKRRLTEERQFIYLDWLISLTPGPCRLIRMNMSVDTKFTQALVTKLKMEFFKKSRGYADIKAFLIHYQFEPIICTTLPVYKEAKCDCINKGTPIRWEVYRTMLL